jgi:hypothetical protein
MKKPSVFIGSSSEGIDVARAVGFQLRDVGEITIWNEGVFKPGESYLESLFNALDRFDFAVLIFTPDDVVIQRGEQNLSPRDNVMFELGLFLGRFGKARTFVLRSNEPINYPSDLAGVTILYYESDRIDKNLRAAVSATCIPIREAIRDLGLAESRGLQQIRDTSSKLQSDVEEAVGLLARARAFETELFLKYQAGLIIDKKEAEILKSDIQDLLQLAKKFKRKNEE